jgi:hypothetical protein
MRFAIALAAFCIATTISKTSSAAQLDCHIELDSSAARLEMCTNVSNETLVTLTWYRQQSLTSNFEAPTPTVIKAFFSPGRDRIWNQIWVAAGSSIVSANDQLNLRKAVFTYGPELLNVRAHAVIDFIANFLADGTSIDEFSKRLTDQLIAEQSASGFDNYYQLICSDIGKSRRASFTLNHSDVSMDLIVGDPTDGCPGRCGPGCRQPYEWRRQQYTQECLNHDACVGVTGHWLKECMQTFLSAAIGYMTAPECPSLKAN